MTNSSFRYPSPEELSRLEREARRMRATEMLRLARRAAAGLRSFLTRPAAVRVKTVGHA